jgi:hypothetical protein
MRFPEIGQENRDGTWNKGLKDDINNLPERYNNNQWTAHADVWSRSTTDVESPDT